MAGCIVAPAAAAVAPLNFTVNLSENVTVDTTGGVPRLALNVGGLTRYADYASGSGTAALVFTYTPTPGDLDLDGIALVSPLQLNGGTIRDVASTDLAALTFTVPPTPGVRVNYPSLLMDFSGGSPGVYKVNGTSYASMNSFLTALGGNFGRTTTATYYNSLGVMQTVAANTPRFDYDPVTKASTGLLLEETRSNLIARSAEFDSATWTKTTMTVTPNAITAPDGTMTADLIDETSSTGQHILNNPLNVVSGRTYTLSVFAKANTRDLIQLSFGINSTIFPAQYANFNLSTGTVTASTGGTAAVQNIGNGWVRCSWTAIATGTGASSALIYAIPNATSGRSPNFTGASTTFYAWGAQVEQGATASSYIPTTTAATTRGADLLSFSAGGSWFNTAVGTVAVRMSSRQSATYYGPGFDNSSTNNTIWPIYTNTNSRLITGGTVQVNFAWPTSIFNTPRTTVLAYALNDAAGVRDNGTLQTDNTVTIPTITQVTMHGTMVGNVYFFQYYPQRAPNAQIQLLSQ